MILDFSLGWQTMKKDNSEFRSDWLWGLQIKTICYGDHSSSALHGKTMVLYSAEQSCIFRILLPYQGFLMKFTYYCFFFAGKMLTLFFIWRRSKNELCKKQNQKDERWKHLFIIPRWTSILFSMAEWF